MTTKQPPKGAFTVTDAGRPSWEKNDCAVRSVSLACGIAYETAHALLKDAGRRDRNGTFGFTVSKALGMPITATDRCTYAQWLAQHLKGTFIVFVTGHFFAVVDGVQLDMGVALYRPRKRLHGFWCIAK